MRVVVDFFHDHTAKAGTVEQLSDEYHRVTSQFARIISEVVNGRLTFGDGIDYDNVAGKWIDYTTNATPDTEDTIAHGLGVIPVGYIVFKQSKAGSLYTGATAWTSSNIYLKCNVASMAVRIFIVPPPILS